MTCGTRSAFMSSCSRCFSSCCFSAVSITFCLFKAGAPHPHPPFEEPGDSFLTRRRDEEEEAKETRGSQDRRTHVTVTVIRPWHRRPAVILRAPWRRSNFGTSHLSAGCLLSHCRGSAVQRQAAQTLISC
mmetsp:Transcript_47978/g.150552  ORF Transcript_47978/g.150552 Transcript_47978/m.150552 type:complete len:130 (+) Transcript_47978:232-621(+)